MGKCNIFLHGLRHYTETRFRTADAYNKVAEVEKVADKVAVALMSRSRTLLRASYSGPLGDHLNNPAGVSASAAAKEEETK